MPAFEASARARIPEAPSSRPKYLHANAEPRTRDEKRSRRKHPVRARTIEVARISKRQLEFERLMHVSPERPRPRTRAECIDGPRPCPWVGCAFHLYLDVSPRSGHIKLNFPDLEPTEMRSSCALDVAEGGPATVEETGELLNLTRERVRQLELAALAKLEATRDMAELRGSDPASADPRTRRHLPIAG